MTKINLRRPLNRVIPGWLAIRARKDARGFYRLEMRMVSGGGWVTLLGATGLEYASQFSQDAHAILDAEIETARATHAAYRAALAAAAE